MEADENLPRARIAANAGPGVVRRASGGPSDRVNR